MIRPRGVRQTRKPLGVSLNLISIKVGPDGDVLTLLFNDVMDYSYFSVGFPALPNTAGFPNDLGIGVSSVISASSTNAPEFNLSGKFYKNYPNLAADINTWLNASGTASFSTTLRPVDCSEVTFIPTPVPPTVEAYYPTLTASVETNISISAIEARLLDIYSVEVAPTTLGTVGNGFADIPIDGVSSGTYHCSVRYVIDGTPGPWSNAAEVSIINPGRVQINYAEWDDQFYRGPTFIAYASPAFFFEFSPPSGWSASVQMETVYTDGVDYFKALYNNVDNATSPIEEAGFLFDVVTHGYQGVRYRTVYTDMASPTPTLVYGPWCIGSGVVSDGTYTGTGYDTVSVNPLTNVQLNDNGTGLYWETGGPAATVSYFWPDFPPSVVGSDYASTVVLYNTTTSTNYFSDTPAFSNGTFYSTNVYNVGSTGDSMQVSYSTYRTIRVNLYSGETTYYYGYNIELGTLPGPPEVPPVTPTIESYAPSSSDAIQVTFNQLVTFDSILHSASEVNITITDPSSVTYGPFNGLIVAPEGTAPVAVWDITFTGVTYPLNGDFQSMSLTLTDSGIFFNDNGPVPNITVTIP